MAHIDPILHKNWSFSKFLNCNFHVRTVPSKERPLQTFWRKCRFSHRGVYQNRNKHPLSNERLPLNNRKEIIAPDAESNHYWTDLFKDRNKKQLFLTLSLRVLLISVCVRSSGRLLQNPHSRRKEHPVYRGGWRGCHGNRVQKNWWGKPAGSGCHQGVLFSKATLF